MVRLEEDAAANVRTRSHLPTAVGPVKTKTLGFSDDSELKDDEKDRLVLVNREETFVGQRLDKRLSIMLDVVFMEGNHCCDHEAPSFLVIVKFRA